ncbi:proprotein convertase subtilisin/kexin type 5-like [Sycon ciliatum]|uniref:proprotein convertase subtilisin/kexin type 5-like n=1 Tax=Sycon ciliatum TaxID=27933 RepID=UPI0031F68CD3
MWSGVVSYTFAGGQMHFAPFVAILQNALAVILSLSAVIVASSADAFTSDLNGRTEDSSYTRHRQPAESGAVQRQGKNVQNDQCAKFVSWDSNSTSWVETCPAGRYSAAGVAGAASLSKCLECSEVCATCSDLRVCTSCSPNFILQNGGCYRSCMTEYVELQRNKGPRASVRLSSSASENLHSVSVQHGRLEVLDVDGHWGTVCNKSFSRQSADVVCRQLGLGIAAAITSGTHPIVGHGAPINRAGINCTGNESSILECPAQHRNAVFCSHVEDVEIKCSGPNTSRSCIKPPCLRGFRPIENEQGHVISCEACDSRCITCSGASGNCSECSFGLFLSRPAGNGSRTCVVNCEDGFYGNVARKQCLPCSPSCLACVNSPTGGDFVCTTCKSSAEYPLGAVCVAACPNHTYVDRPSNACRLCSEKCLTCADGYGNGTCTSCRTPLVLDRTSSCVQRCAPPRFALHGRCVATQCPDGYYEDMANQACRTCPALESCLSCANATHCALCQFPALEERGKCVQRCSPGLHAEDILPSRQRARLVGGTSFAAGRVEIFHANQWGAVCDFTWGLPQAMVICRQLGYGNVTIALLPRMNTDFSPVWPASIRSCRGDESTLLSCNLGRLDTQRCHDSTDFARVVCGDATVRRCISQCPHGHYGSPLTGCNRCAAYCQTCHSTPSNCTDCYQGYYRLNSKCLGNCPDGYFADSVNNVCTPCSSECAWCSGASTNCTGCGLGKYLQNNTCVAKCGTKFIQDSQPEIRLTQLTSLFEGILEAYFEGQWRPICYDGKPPSQFGQRVCRELNLGIALKTSESPRNFYDMSVLKVFHCSTWDRTITECIHFANSFCSYNYVKVKCSGPDTSRRCLQHCPTGHSGWSDGRCHQCHFSCAECFDRSDFCTKCNYGYVAEAGECKVSCSSDFYNDRGACVQCHSSCLHCNGRSETDCIECKHGEF